MFVSTVHPERGVRGAPPVLPARHRRAPPCAPRRTAPPLPPPAPRAAIDPLELAKHRPLLLKYALRRLRDAAHAGDVVQETLVAALEGAGRYQGNASVGTWLIGILKHKILDHFRRGRREAPLAGGGDGPEDGDRDAAAAPDERVDPAAAPRWGDPEAAFARERFFEVLERGIARLPGTAARAFRMREVLGMSTDEICAELGITATHCAVLLHRARASLREYLEAEWFGNGGAARGLEDIRRFRGRGGTIRSALR